MIRAIIIDDETAAIKTLSMLMEKHVPGVRVVASASVGTQGIALIEEHKPEVVFLDISMPDMSGFALLQKLKYREFHLIFTTAHQQYALQAIKHHATDYLLKPIDIDELKQAIQTVVNLGENLHAGKLADAPSARRLEPGSRIGLPIREGLVYHLVADIIWIESQGNYCIFHTSDAKKYVVSRNIGEYESLLPEKEFFRAHKSYLINIRKVKKYIRTDGYFVEMEDGAIVEISRRRKDEFLQLMNELS